MAESLEPLKRILYVDDDPSVCELVEVALEMSGDLQLCICRSGREALDQTKVFAPQLIVMDVNMPGLDGPATLSSLKQKGVDVPVVFVTAETNPETLNALKQFAPQDILIKPFDPFRLQDRLLGIWRSMNSCA